MGGILDKLDEWLRGLLADGIKGNLTGMFDSVNTEVGEMARQVGMTPQAWNLLLQFGNIKNRKCGYTCCACYRIFRLIYVIPKFQFAFFPYPANRETICDPGESVVNCLLCKSCYHFFVLTGGSNQYAAKGKCRAFRW